MSSNPILRRLVLLGTPLVTAVLMLFHPLPYEDITGELVPIASWWTALHTIQFVLFAIMGAAVWLLTKDYVALPRRPAKWRRWSWRCSTISGTLWPG